jgi:hypothetical protein
MIEPGSRYQDTPTARHVTASGHTIVYLRRRFVPPADALTPVARAVFTEGDRLDLVSARTIGDPLQYWRICDANETMNPAELEAEPGRVLWISAED